MPVHFEVTLVKWMKLYVLQKYKLFIVEDCAEALALYKGRPVGVFGKPFVFGNKAITTGEGGSCLK